MALSTILEGLPMTEYVDSHKLYQVSVLVEEAWILFQLKVNATLTEYNGTDALE